MVLLNVHPNRHFREYGMHGLRNLKAQQVGTGSNSFYAPHTAERF